MENDDEDGIVPRLTAQEAHGLRPVLLPDGREQFPSLPRLTTNSLQGMIDHTKLCDECQASPYLDRGAHTKNRLLGKSIDLALNFFRPPDKDGQHFILQWRLYPNKDHPRFKELDGCSCGCGCSSLPPPPPSDNP